MAITATEWLITSDVALEAAFRVDLPEPSRGSWVLSYLPTDRRLTREQALLGVALAEMILLDQPHSAAPFDLEVGRLHAAQLGLTLHDVMCLLALRADGNADPLPCPPNATGDRDSAPTVAEGTTVFAV
ncbi:hypothetical protein APR12_006264 [Nocardia amikacinitolerans]|uniref:hypothetical protein n=1 Tax=Nocardia amikacinitolerans TaxID=756689 RepID=UPI00082AC8F9|nr:hypothetical protein [Nocardia amikacinitolerans]MCP2320874.1 hypothetical protein [Nocardia amikacinitolerans]